jgi:polysaccharide export outer membrane protein
MSFLGSIRKASASFLQNLHGTPGSGVRSNIQICIISFFVFGFTSCVSTRSATYFNDLGDSVIPSDLSVPESLIQKNDILSISVSSLNPEATLLFNTPNNSVNAQSSGYLVAADGTIQFPILGNIKAEGLNKTQLKDRLTQSILEKKLLLDPNVTIRFLNFRVTILGEVSKPTVVTVPSEKISLLEALGLAGDMTVFAKRHNVMVIRENNNQKIIKRINLNSTELFRSPYYYLQSNDIVYVEPNKSKVASASDTRQLLPIVLSGLSLAAIVMDRIVR